MNLYNHYNGHASQLPNYGAKAMIMDILLMITGPGLLLAGPLFRKKCGGPYYINTLSPDCLQPTRTVVIIDILLMTPAAKPAMHTTIAEAAVWQFGASLSEANCK